MANQVSICSNALLLLGSQTISDMGENNDRARTAANLYPAVRSRILRAHSWNCAKRRVLLSPMVDKPAFDWKNQFALPGDWIRNIQVGNKGCAPDYLTEGRRILANVDSLPLVYVSNLTNEAAFDEALTYAMTVGMSAAMAYPITKSTSVQQAQEALLKDFLKAARNQDGQDDPPQEFGDSPLYQARFGTFPLAPGRT